MQFAIGFLLALGISSAAVAAGSLNRTGGVAAVALGTAVYAFGRWPAAAVLLVFFLGSSLLERLLGPIGRRPAGAYAKGGRRDAGQVLGNGVVATVFAVLIHYNPDSAWPWLGFAGSLAAVNADTWATELGALSPDPPRLITHPSRPVRAGTSGAVSLVGSSGAVLGSVLIGFAASGFVPVRGASMILAIAAGGLAGAFIDSYLGATVQSMYVCTAEHLETEQHPIHRCGAPTLHRRGWPWVSNDVVNFACAACGALVAPLIAFGAASL